MPLNERDYMKAPRHIPVRGRSAREQQSINNNALGYWRRQRRRQRLIKSLVPTFFIVSLGIIGSVYFMPQDALRDNQLGSGAAKSAKTFIEQIRASLTPSCDTRLRNAMEADRKAKNRIGALDIERMGIEWRALGSAFSGVTANEIERMQSRVDSINREIDRMERKRFEYQRIMDTPCIGSD